MPTIVNMGFVHLRTHTEYSVVDGSLRIDDLAAAALRDGQAALAITDLVNLFGAVKFYKACRNQGVKPIIGADLWMEPHGADRDPTRLLVLVANHAGYLGLCEVLSRAWTTNVHRNQAWVKWSWLQEFASGWIVLSGADQGLIGQALLAGDNERAHHVAEQLKSWLGTRFYIELQRAGSASHEACVRRSVPLAAALGLPVVATHPVQFLTPEDFEAHEARVCIAEGETLANPRRVKRFTREQYFLSREQMHALFADIPSALDNAERIAMRCNLQLTLGQARLPEFPTPVRADGTPTPIETYFRDLAAQGLAQRLQRLYPDESQRAQEAPAYEQRLEFEINTILKMGFPGYFLIVGDFIRWARENDCPVGPGRGSGAGSLVAYSLGITDLDPLRYKLLFERFLNPDRISMPDFDIDFCQAHRDQVIEYVKSKYGRDAVSQIATFGTMAAKAALRDVGRVLGMSYGHVDSVAKLIPAPPGKSVTLARPGDTPDPGLIYARKESPELEKREAAEEEVAELLALAERVEGLVRNVGMHAGGVLIAPGKITDFCPLYQQPGSDAAVSQFYKDDVEAIGLVKFDFLGLATLTILELAKTLIRSRRAGLENFSFEDLPLDDASVYQLFSDAKTEAVFQFESAGMRRMLRDARPSRIEDLIALNAMFRPGPMENIPSFCARKHGREPISFPHPLLEPVLAETYGIMVYQEQVMQAAQVMGGYSLGQADLLRRAMGKKKPEEMAQQREIFRQGAQAQGIDQAKADEVFDLMERFAGYGFNKSHAAAYSVLAYHTAWLKTHCTAEFYAANMTVEMDDTDKLKVLLHDARELGISFEPPDVNRGGYRFEPVSDTLVRYGLGAIKGTGQGAIEAIVAAREGQQGQGGGPFRSLFDFCARVDRQRVNKRVVEALIKAGAFDAVHPDRSSALASVSLAFDWADTQEANANQGGLFDFGDDEPAGHGSSSQEPSLVSSQPWGIRERLLLEKSALGFILSGHLFTECHNEVRQFARRRIEDLTDSRESQLVAGIVEGLKVINTNRGRVALFTLGDGSATIETAVNDELLESSKGILVEDALLVVQGRVMVDRASGGLRLNVNQMWDMSAARARFGRYLEVTVGSALPPVAEVIRTWPEQRQHTDHGEISRGLAIRLCLRRPEVSADIELGDAALFWPCDEALARWRQLALDGQASVVYATSDAPA